MAGGYGAGWSGPTAARQGVAPFNPLMAALQSAREARGGGGSARGGGGGRVEVLPDQDAELEAQLGSQPDIVAPGEPRLADDASPDEIVRYATQPRSFMVGGRPYQQDPRIALGLELARQRQAQGVQQQAQVSQAAIQRQQQEERVQRLIAAGYSQKEATRQVFGGPRTVQEEQELINTRSADQLAKDKLIQGEITSRAQEAAAARAALQVSLERSRSGDRAATLELRKNQILLQDATRAHQAALKARTSNALGGMDMGDPAIDPADAELNAAVSQHLDDVQSTEAARQGAIAGVRRAGAAGAPGADGISDKDAAAFLGVRTPQAFDDGSGGTVQGADPMAPYHAAFRRGALPGQTGPGQGLKPAPKPLQDHQVGPAAKDPAYRSWLMSKGYDVSSVPRPDDEQQEEQPDDESAEF